jgi:WD40 repeat protein
MTHRLSAACVAVACLSLAACNDKRTNKPPVEGASDGSEKVGAELFTYAKYPEASTEGRGAEPITVPMANVVVLNKLDLPSRVDGTVLFVGVEITADEAGRRKEGKYFHERTQKWYRQLEPGNFVKKDQVVALLDDEQAFVEYQGAKTKADAAKKSAVSYEVTVRKLNEIVDRTAEAVRRKIQPEQELTNAEATAARYQAELVDHQGSADVAASDEKKAKYIWDKHLLRPVVGGEVQQVLKHPGDGVKASEPVLTLHDLGRLRAVGNLPKEYVSVIGRGDEVSIEVAQNVPYGATFDQHTTNRPIAAVAVAVVGAKRAVVDGKPAVAGGKPVVVSAGEDGWVYTWGRDLKPLGGWRQPAGVRSLAVTRPGAGDLVLVGGVNGTARLYDLANPQAKDPVREFEGRHDGGVAAAAFSPDGQFCVTADERAIYMYDVATGKRKYTFPTREHHSPVTSLSFTPQGRVISAGREPSVRVWLIGQDGAKVEHRVDSRSGDVTALGVTDDGSRLLLDADKTRLDVMHLQELRKERPLMTAGEAGRFTTFAAWSPELGGTPDNRLIVTTGGAEGVVQLWRAPTAADHGAEVARLMTRGAAAATCAAFSPVAENGFVVVGTRKGDVHLWALPTGTDVKDNVPAAVTFVEPNIESSGRTVNVLVDFNNPKHGDQYAVVPGSAVTLVIRPKK